MMPNSSEAARLHEIPFDPSPEAVAGSPEGALDAEHLIPATWIEWFVIAQTAIPAVLFIPGMQVFRLPVDSAGRKRPSGIRNTCSSRLRRSGASIDSPTPYRNLLGAFDKIAFSRQ